MPSRYALKTFAEHGDLIATLPAAAVHRRVPAGVWVRADWRSATPATRPPLDVPLLPTDGPWDPLHRWAATGDPQTIGHAVLSYADKLPPVRGDQLRELVKTYPPPPAPGRADACRYTLELHNAVNGRPEMTKRHVAYADAAKRWGWPPAWPADELHCHTTASGIGDAVVGVYVACGLADATGRPVTYHVDYPDWMLGLIDHSGVRLVSKAGGRYGPDMWGGWYGYDWETHHAATRAGAWCDNLAAGYGLPAFTPARPRWAWSHPTGDVPDGPYVVAAPTANWSTRNWPAERWRALFRLVVAAGFRVVVIGRPAHFEQIKAIVLPCPPAVTHRYGTGPGAVRDLLLGASCVIGNDSGIAHVAGLLNVPTVAVHPGSLPHEFLFACAPSVRSVTAPGTVPRSGANTGALHGITAEAAFAAVAEHRRWRPMPVDPGRVGVCSLATPDIDAVADVTFPNHAAYAARHGYQVRHHRGPSLAPGRPAMWGKIPWLRRNLPDLNWAMWIDADAAFTNMDRPLDAVLTEDADLVVVRDGNGLNNGVFAIRNTPATLALLDRTWEQTRYINWGYHEQGAMAHLIESGQADGVRVRWVSKRTLNAYPEDWQPGDLVVHVPGRGGKAELLREALAGR